MRARKADRCLQRADEALDTGSIGEASDALDEARQLSPQHPRLPELSARLEALKHPAPTAQRHRFVWTTAAIVAGVVAFSAAGWQAWVHRDQLDELVPKALPNTDTRTGMASPASAPTNAPSDSNAEAAAANVPPAAANDTIYNDTCASGICDRYAHRTSVTRYRDSGHHGQ